MSYDKTLEERIDQMFLEDFPEDHQFVEVKNMFGGLAYLYRGKMAVGILGDTMMARILGEKMHSVLQEDAVRPMDFTGRSLKEFVFVENKGFKHPEQLKRWLQMGLEHAKTKVSMS